MLDACGRTADDANLLDLRIEQTLPQHTLPHHARSPKKQDVLAGGRFHQATLPLAEDRLESACEGKHGNLLAATIVSRAKTARSASCAMRNGGSLPLGANACNAGTLRKHCTTNTKQFR